MSCFPMFLLVLVYTASLSLSLVVSPNIHRRDAIAGGVDLRILPFGDSITFGQASSDGNGYRQPLLNKLIPGNQVQFVGILKTGKMQNNAHEGHQGFDIGLIMKKGMPDFSTRPNVVLLMLGTNNIVRDIHFDQAPRLLGELINTTVKACPDAAVIVSTVTPLLNSTLDARRVQYNNALPAVVGRFASYGDKVSLVNMTGVEKQHINKWDKTHPTDAGYQLVAENFYKGIVDAGAKGWIRRPFVRGAQVEVVSSTTITFPSEASEEEPTPQVTTTTIAAPSSTKPPASASSSSSVQRPAGKADSQQGPTSGAVRSSILGGMINTIYTLYLLFFGTTFMIGVAIFTRVNGFHRTTR